MRLGVPFIAPRQLGAVGGILGRQFLPSVEWRTGQYGAPPDSPVHHRTIRCTTGQFGAPPDIPCSLSGADRLPKLAQPTVEDLEPLTHRTLSGAHRTVRCPHQTVGSATRHARIARPTVGSPDSPMNFSRTPPTNSRERLVDQTPAWRTGHCPVHHRTVRCTQTAQSLGCSSQVFFLLYFL
jgi:hypothetical protein